MKKLTGWDALYADKKYQTEAYTHQGKLIPKSAYVKYGVWDEHVDFLVNEVADSFEEAAANLREYGCSEKEIAGYIVQHSDPVELVMAATA